MMMMMMMMLIGLKPRAGWVWRTFRGGKGNQTFWSPILLNETPWNYLKMRSSRFHRYMGFVSKWIKMGCAPNQLVDYIFAMKNYHKLGPNIISTWWYLALSSISPWYPHNILRKCLERVCFLMKNHKIGSRGKCYFAEKKSRGAPKARDGDRQWGLGKSCPRSNPQAHFGSEHGGLHPKCWWKKKCKTHW